MDSTSPRAAHGGRRRSPLPRRPHLHRPVDRAVRLLLGLTLYGASVAMLIEAGLGTMPWSVLEVGIAERLGLDVGLVIVLVSFVVLLLWLPLRQRPGIGTVANALWVGPATTLTLHLLPMPGTLPARLALAVSGVLLNGLATGLYIGARLGPGPRDGLMTGLHGRTGLSLRLVRTGIEIAVVATGFVLGGVVGVGTVMYALAIGPLAQHFLRLFDTAPEQAPVRAPDQARVPVSAGCARAPARRRWSARPGRSAGAPRGRG